MRALICGSVAFDTIMVFNGHFRSHILPDQLHMLNVSFLVPELRREYGGCAGNIAYNMRLLGDEGVPMATVGADAERYVGRLRELGISTDLIRTVEGEYTAQAFITTDLDDNQITAFHPGAMNSAHLNAVSSAQNMSLGIIAPDGREGMLQHAQQFADAGIPFLFDPGQGLPMFDGDELRRFIEQASWVAVNEYEWHLLQSRTGLSIAEVTARVKALIITRGAEGSSIHLREPARNHSPGKAPGVGGPDRLRRCLSGGHHSRPTARAELAGYGAHGIADGCTQDRGTRHPKSSLHPAGICRPLRGRFWSAARAAGGVAEALRESQEHVEHVFVYLRVGL